MSIIDRFSRVSFTSGNLFSDVEEMGIHRLPDGGWHCSCNVLVSAQKIKTPTNRQVLPPHLLYEIDRILHDGVRYNHGIQDLYVMMETSLSQH